MRSIIGVTTTNDHPEHRQDYNNSDKMLKLR